MARVIGRLPKANVSVLGYALFVTINATSLWGGVFPFFPIEFHTPTITLLFSLAQSIAYCATFFLTALVIYYRPMLIRRAMVFAGGIPIVLGACCLIAAMYLRELTPWLVGAGGVLLGCGCAGFAMAWQRYFSAEAPERGTYFLLAGTALAPFLFFSLYLIPSAVTVYLVPTILVPLCGLCALLATRTIDMTQSQFAETPCEHPKVYRRLMSDYWRSALGIGAFGFVSGIVRAAAVTDPSIGDATNAATMLGALAASVILIVAWRRWSFQFDSITAFRAIFPIAITCLAVFPFLGRAEIAGLAGVVYAIFAVVYLMLLLQCAQASRDRGVNPAFIFGFYGGIVYLLQNLGFIVSYSTDMVWGSGENQLFVVAVVGLYVLGMALVLQYRGRAQRRDGTGTPDSIEFIQSAADGLRASTGAATMAAAVAAPTAMPATATEPSPKERVSSNREDRQAASILASHNTQAGEESPAEPEAALATASTIASAKAPAKAAEEEPAVAVPTKPARPQEAANASDGPAPAARRAPKAPARRASAANDDRSDQQFRDRLSKQCLMLKERFQLSNRETEVMELAVRGNSVSRISELLFISENTVRTHMKHIYAKLNIHKRQEILTLIEELEEESAS